VLITAATLCFRSVAPHARYFESVAARSFECNMEIVEYARGELIDDKRLLPLGLLSALASNSISNSLPNIRSDMNAIFFNHARQD